MKYVALLRGVNAGGNRTVEMKRLKGVLENLGCKEISTYINSGNATFESSLKRDDLQSGLQARLKKEFGFEIMTLIKTQREMKKIAEAIPKEWQNDLRQRTDVAYLFKEIDSKKILAELPMNTEFMDIRYVKGAVFWNIDRKNYTKTRLNKLIGHKAYKLMTIRNVNTARFLANGKN